MRNATKVIIFLIVFLAISIIIHFFVSEDGASLIGYSVLGENISKLEERTINTPKSTGEFYFDNGQITYALDIDATDYTTDGTKKANDEYEKERIRWALRIIENSTDNLIQFKEVEIYENPNIMIYGRPPKETENNDRFITEGSAGPTEILDNKILKSEVILYASKSGGYRGETNTFVKDGYLWESTEYDLIETISWEADACKEFPQTELHEILHALGFDHVYDDSYSIMAPIKHKIQSCKVKEIDKEIASCLKYIYSNGEIGEGCSNLNMYPWPEEQNITDFKWGNIPVSYSVFDCNEKQKWNLQKAEKVLEKYVGHNLYEFKENENSQVNFYCHNSFDDVLLNEDTDFWDTTVYFPSAQPYYNFENDKIKEVKILLFAEDRDCGGIEIHELLHGIGLRNRYGSWMKSETELCNTNVMIIDRKSIDKVKEIYGLV